jgi:hypothetical protein
MYNSGNDCGDDKLDKALNIILELYWNNGFIVKEIMTPKFLISEFSKNNVEKFIVVDRFHDIIKISVSKDFNTRFIVESIKKED